MKPEKVLNIAQEIKGMPVIMLERGQRLGRIVDVIIHPTEGVVTGLVVSNEQGEERLLLAADCFVFQELGVAMVTPEGWDESQQMPEGLQGGLRICEQLQRLEVLTKNGKSLGQVVAVYATEVELRTIYRVATYRLRLFERSVFFIPGNLPQAWVKQRGRLIVSDEEVGRTSCSTLQEALKYF